MRISQEACIENLYRRVAEAILCSTHLLITAGNHALFAAKKITDFSHRRFKELDFQPTAVCQSTMTLQRSLHFCKPRLIMRICASRASLSRTQMLHTDSGVLASISTGIPLLTADTQFSESGARPATLMFTPVMSMVTS